MPLIHQQHISPWVVRTHARTHAHMKMFVLEITDSLQMSTKDYININTNI